MPVLCLKNQAEQEPPYIYKAQSPATGNRHGAPRSPASRAIVGFRVRHRPASAAAAIKIGRVPPAGLEWLEFA
jgi:hypothetical protein